MSPANQPWYQIMNVEEIPSPALLLFPDRVQSNIQGMLDMVDGDTERLCPHVKTIKTEAIIRMMVRSGIKQFKCATIAEGETASATFVDIVEGRISQDELDDVLFDLLEYCKRDTEAMVRIWQRLQVITMNGDS